MRRVRTTTARRILELLARDGVRTAFGLPGVHNLPLWDALHDPRPLDLLTVRHELTAAFAADGLARATGGLGVAVVTSGPGAANTVAAVGEAAAARSPLLVVASDVPLAARAPDRVRGLLHESRDQGALFAPLAKSVLQPASPEAAVAAAELAVRTALQHPRGPVYLGIPADVLTAPAPAPPRRMPTEPIVPAAAELAHAADLLAAARRPVLLAGGGVVAADAERALDALAWRLGAPVLTSYAARGVLPPGHPFLIDLPVADPVVDRVLGAADLLLVLGCALDGMTTRNWTIARPAVVVDVNVAPSRELTPEATVIGDVGTTVDALTVRLGQRTPWADSPFALREHVLHRLRADAASAPAVALVDAVGTSWPDDAVVTCDMAVAGYWVGGYAAQPRPRRLAYPVGWGTLGFGLPAAIGAATTGRCVLAVVGDGGLAMCTGELATVVQERLPVTVLLVDDGGYGMLRFDARRTGQPTRGVDLLTPDWTALARAYQMPVRVTTTTTLSSDLRWAAQRRAPTLLVWQQTLLPPPTTSPRWPDP